jgi:hypothetical protein
MRLAFLYRFETADSVVKWKVVEARAFSYSPTDAGWMNDPDLSPSSVLTPSVELVDAERVFDSEDDALRHLALFYSRQVA